MEGEGSRNIDDFSTSEEERDIDDKGDKPFEKGDGTVD